MKTVETSAVTLIGEHPFATDAQGRIKNRIATIFVNDAVLVTLRGTHATQRLDYLTMLNDKRRKLDEPPMTRSEITELMNDTVDLIVDADGINIRPDPQNMPLAFAADRLLQLLPNLSKRNIRFLYAGRDPVRQAIRARGEYWRIAPLPRQQHDIIEMIETSRTAIGGADLYYFSHATGTRYLTLQRFLSLGDMSDADRERHFREISEYAKKNNRLGHPELKLFGVDKRFDPLLSPSTRGQRVHPANTLKLFEEAAARFFDAVPRELREDNPNNLRWRNAMYACLIGQTEDDSSADVLPGVTPEFFRQIRWLPGGCIEEGELIFDSIFSEADCAPSDSEVRSLCDEKVKGIIFNYIREFGNIEHINIGQIDAGVRRHARTGGHLAYIAEIKHAAADRPIVRMIRIQKWGIREHLNDGKELLRAIVEAEDYTEFVLDRRLGCWQLGLPLPSQIMTRRIFETYPGKGDYCRGTRIWTTYFERDYIDGMATDNVPSAHYRDARFVEAFAQLLGEAAAPNLIVGRGTLDGKTLFDDGDEILVLDDKGFPTRIVVADHAGTFVLYEQPLSALAPAYALPVLNRRDRIEAIDRFAEAYLLAFHERFARIQRNYRRHRRAFDSLFKQARQEKGSFSWRWRLAIERLDHADAAALTEQIRNEVKNHR